MKVLIFFIFLSYFSYSQNKMTTTLLLEKNKSNLINYATNLKVNTYTQKFNTFIASINTSTLHKKTDFYKAYFKTIYTSNKKQVVLKSFSPRFNSDTFSIPLKYKYKNGSTCFYLLKSCKN
jgi:hypothetical protein